LPGTANKIFQEIILCEEEKTVMDVFEKTSSQELLYHTIERIQDYLFLFIENLHFIFAKMQLFCNKSVIFLMAISARKEEYEKKQMEAGRAFAMYHSNVKYPCDSPCFRNTRY
jgi:hypothetical protein